MPSTSPLYRLIAGAAVPAVPLLLRDAHQRDAHRARLASPALLEAWARERRDPARPLAWFHAPSVGEGLQARAVMQALRRLRPDMQFIYTHYSPSAVEFAATIGTDWSGYLGYDRPRDVERMLAAAAPTLLVFTKLDLWPELAVRAANRGARVAMVAATVSPESGRLRWPSRSLTRAGYAALDIAAAITTEDATRLQSLGCRADRIAVTGDPRVDSVLDVVAQPSKDAAVGGEAGTIVAGSTWAEDELIVLEAFEHLRDHHPDAHLIIAPHDPASGRLQRIAAVARELGLPEPVRYSRLVPGESPVITVVDRIGLLARLYRRGVVAYVGGGWGSAGIHSVLEPAAWSLPVIIGPNDRGSRDAELLRSAGALRQLHPPATAKELLVIFREWLDHPDQAAQAGNAGRAALERERGAAAKSAELLAVTA
jgi:3-deoxy-D-manno-octulosonic-acid transferase